MTDNVATDIPSTAVTSATLSGLKSPVLRRPGRCLDFGSVLRDWALEIVLNADQWRDFKASKPTELKVVRGVSTRTLFRC